ncbi:unnamed protein product, partial [Allacma fusca]
MMKLSLLPLLASTFVGVASSGTLDWRPLVSMRWWVLRKLPFSSVFGPVLPPPSGIAGGHGAHSVV